MSDEFTIESRPGTKFVIVKDGRDVAVALDDPFAQELVDAANEYEQRVRFGTMFPYAFTTGAHIAPVLIDGQWRWVVTNFEGITFVDGECRNPNEYADTQEGLVDPEE
jgi:hypothetical protein